MKHQDLFASKVSELGHTDTVKMQIDIGKNVPIKMKPYRTQIKNREVIDKAINEMLDADVIRRCRSPWSFPVVIEGWMDELGFYVPSTEFQSFRDDGRVNMKGSVQ